MKKLLLTILSLTIFISVFSQEHFTFKGIQIDGSSESVGSQLKSIGYEAIDKTILKGKFINKDCKLLIIEGENHKYVNAIMVVLDDSYTTWKSLKSDFNSLVDMYQNKYGEPLGTKCEFDGIYYDGDGYELSALKSGKLSMSAIWVNVEGKGSIMISVNNDTTIYIYYVDDANRKLEKEAQAKLNQDEI